MAELKLNSKLQVSQDLAPIGIWLNKPVNTWKLLYKWTIDEKTKAAWHHACDGKGPTVTIVRTKDGHVFGGYNPLAWWVPRNNGDSEFKESKESFIFSLTDGKGRQAYQCLPYNYCQYAICSFDSNNGLGWGGGLDLYINPEATVGSYSNLNNTYKLPQGFVDGRTWLAGSYNNWQIIEIETYSV